jgi:hypothetical protein
MAQFPASRRPPALAPRGPGEDTSPVRVIPPRHTGPWVLAGVALLVGLVCGLPHILIPTRLAAEGKRYAPLAVSGVASQTTEEVLRSAPRLREILDGHPFSADPTGREYKARAPRLGEGLLDSLLTGWLAALLGRSTPNVFIVCDFILPPLGFLLLFLVCQRLGAPLWVSLAAAAAGIVAPAQNTLLLEWLLSPRLSWLTERLHLLHNPGPLEWCGLTVPQAVFLPAGLALLGLVTLYDHPRLRAAITTGMALGATVYCHPAPFAFLLAGGALLAAGALLSPAHRRAAPLLALALATGLVLALPVIYQAVSPVGFPGKAEIAARLAGQAPRNWEYEVFPWALLALLGAAYPRRRPEFLPVMAFTLAPFVALLGARAMHAALDEEGLLRLCWQPWSALALVLLLWALWSDLARRRAERSGDSGSLAAMTGGLRRHRAVAWAFGALCALILAYGTNAQARFAWEMAPAYCLPADQRQALEELRLRAPADSVVLCLGADVLALLPVYTGCNDYLPNGATSPAPTAELKDRAAVALAAFGVPPSRAQLMLQFPALHLLPSAGRELPRAYDLGHWLFASSEMAQTSPPTAQGDLAARASAHGPEGYRRLAKRYRVDFIWWGPHERAVGDPALEARLSRDLFLEAGQIRVYRVRQSP